MSLPAAPLNHILKTVSPYRRLYYRWKALRLPWRRRYFIGMDLEGNTFWEFRDRLVPSRPRRIMDFRGGVHSLVNYADMRVDPQWHQWLRVTRIEPPTIQELTAEVTRRKVMVERARLADERWAKGSSLLKRPGEEELKQLEERAVRTAASDGSAIAVSDAVTVNAEKEPEEVIMVGKRRVEGSDTTVEEMQERLRIEREKRGRPEGPSESFQPAAWTPKGVER
ncbi:hypothetical protein ABW20_dc0102321 [Dactylellina cionopaga]|nr:hypothetical protein ABW20_dc0102321 [Dactylellina cionopaga]